MSSLRPVTDSGSNRDELSDVARTLESLDLETDSDYAVGPKLLSFGGHSLHRELTGVVQRLSEHCQLMARGKLTPLVADVIDRAADDQPERFKPRILDQKVFVHGQVRRE